MTSVDALPDDAESLQRLLMARQQELAVARGQVATAAAEAAALRAKAADDEALIVHLKLDGMAGDTGKDVGQPGLGIDVVELGGNDEAVKTRHARV